MIVDILGFTPSYSAAPMFYVAVFSVGFAICALPATLFVNWMMQRRSKPGSVNPVFLEALDDGVTRRALGDGVTRLPKDICRR